MSAAEHLQGEQLSLFLPAYKLRQLPSLEEEGWPSGRAMWAAKAKDNREDGLGQHIKEHGVHVPVPLAFDGAGELSINGGHHRIQAAFHADPSQLVPVQYAELRERGRPLLEQPVPGWEERNRFGSMP